MYWLIIILLPCTSVVIFSVAHFEFSLGRNWTRYPVSEGDFRSAYLSVCSNGKSGFGATNLNDVRFLPLLFVVLSISVRLAPEHLAGDARTRRITSLRYYWACSSPLLTPSSCTILIITKLGDLFSLRLQSSLIHLTSSLLACW